MAARELHIEDLEIAFTTIIPAQLLTRMISPAESSARLRTGNGKVLRIITMTLKLSLLISLVSYSIILNQP